MLTGSSFVVNRENAKLMVDGMRTYK